MSTRRRGPLQRGGAIARGETGQGTLEYALVLFAFAATLVSLAAVWHAARDGALVRLAVGASSHSMGEGSYAAAMQDALLF